MNTSCQRLLAAIALSVATASMAATPATLPTSDKASEALNPQVWRIDGGDLRLRFNGSYLDLFGIHVERSAAVLDKQNPEFAIFPVLSSGGVRFNAPDGGFDRFLDGSLTIRGGFELKLADGSRIDLRNATVRPDASNPANLELVGADGQAWLYVNHLMYQFEQNYRAFNVRSADLRATAALAKRVGEPALRDAYVGELNLYARVMERSREITAQPKGNAPIFHGTTHPSGGIYEADVLISDFTMQFMRCRRANQTTNGCDGAGVDDGEVVFAPSATLRNSNTARTADVPWYTKFTTSPYSYPYPGNDQHPFLIWNAYRIVDGQLEQIAASGTKHAWLTINQGCAAGAFTGNGHILGLNCSDTYGTGNNDDITDLGPRSEILPAVAVWGRCNSIFDTNCDGQENGVPACQNTNSGCYDQRMVMRESQLQVPGATYFTEAWYVVQDDINIYNTMGRRSMVPAPGGGGWVVGTQSTMALGPLINNWVDPVANPTSNVEFSSSFGRARVAVKVKTLSACPAASTLTGTCYRYDYAVHNFDFGASATSGTAPNVSVAGSKGFDSFRIGLNGPTGIFIEEAVNFADIDINPANSWTATVTADAVEWTAPVNNTLNWGTLFRFSLVSNQAPSAAVVAVSLRPANTAQGAQTLTRDLVGPSGLGNGIMKNGFEAPL